MGGGRNYLGLFPLMQLRCRWRYIADTIVDRFRFEIRVESRLGDPQDSFVEGSTCELY